MKNLDNIPTRLNPIVFISYPRHGIDNQKKKKCDVLDGIASVSVLIGLNFKNPTYNDKRRVYYDAMGI